MRGPFTLVAFVLVVASGMRALVAEAPVALAAPAHAGAASEAGASDARVTDVVATGDASSSTCRVEIRGGVVADVECRVARRDFASDGGPTTVLVLQTDPTHDGGDPSAFITMLCVGRPPVGFQGDPTPGCIHAKATVSKARVEWIGISGAQGTFTLRITSVRTIKLPRGEAYELHGVLDAELPVSNSFAQPVTIRATF